MILVTGGTGLVGAHLLLQIVETRNFGSEKVRAIYRNPKSIEKTKNLFSLYNKLDLFSKIEWFHADINDIPLLEKAFEGIDYVYHCAALISFDPQDEDLIRKTNIEGTANIVNFCLANSVQKLFFFSSIAALGDVAAPEIFITEETEWNPEKAHSDYAISKYGAEMEIWRGQQEGLQVVIANPGVIIGPGFWEQGSGTLFTRVLNGLSFYTAGSTGFVAVSDVVRIAVALMNSSIHNERFILVAKNNTFREILNAIADALAVKRPQRLATPFLLGFLWRLDWIVSKIFQRPRKLTKDTAIAASSVNKFSNEKITKVLGTDFLDIEQYIKAIVKLQ